MQDKVEGFFSRLHAIYLKPSGYKKSRHTFVRERDGFTERIQFQGSSWNSRDSAWRFYVNFGIQFHGLPSRTPDRDLPGTHCWTRIDGLVDGAPKEFDVTGDDDKLARDIAFLLEQASDRVTAEISKLRGRYENAPTPRLSVQ